MYFFTISIYFYLWISVLWTSIWPVLENEPHVLEKSICNTVVWWSILLTSIESSWFIMLFMSSISCCSSASLFYLPLNVRHWNLQIRSNYCYIFLVGRPFYHYKMPLFYSNHIFVLKSISADVSIFTLTFLCLLFAWYIIFHSCNIYLFLSLNLKHVSYKNI